MPKKPAAQRAGSEKNPRRFTRAASRLQASARMEGVNNGRQPGDDDGLLQQPAGGPQLQVRQAVSINTTGAANVLLEVRQLPAPSIVTERGVEAAGTLMALCQPRHPWVTEQDVPQGGQIPATTYAPHMPTASTSSQMSQEDGDEVNQNQVQDTHPADKLQKTTGAPGDKSAGTRTVASGALLQMPAMARRPPPTFSATRTSVGLPISASDMESGFDSWFEKVIYPASLLQRKMKECMDVCREDYREIYELNRLVRSIRATQAECRLLEAELESRQKGVVRDAMPPVCPKKEDVLAELDRRYNEAVFCAQHALGLVEIAKKELAEGKGKAAGDVPTQ